MAQLVKNAPAMWEIWVPSLGWEDPLEKGKATHSSTLAWRIPYSPWTRKESNTTEWLSLYFPGLQNQCGWWLQPWNWKTLAPWKESYDKPKQYNKKHRHYFANKDPFSQSYGFSSSHVWMWELNNKKGWVPKNWCFWTVVLEKILESPLDCKEIKPVNPKGNQSWKFIGRTNAKAETWILWPPDAKSRLIGKDPHVGKGWRQERGMT